MCSPSRILLATAALLTLAACDASDPTNLPDDLVGSWTVTGFENRQFVTTNSDQRPIDRTQPGDGTLTVSGDETATLHHLSEAYRSDDFTFFNVASDSNAGVGLPSFPLTILNLNRTDGTWSVGLTVQDDDTGTSQRTYLAEPRATPPPFTYDAGRLTVPAITLPGAFGTSGSITVGGVLTFVTRSAPAGVETTLGEYVQAFPSGPVYTFEADGTFRATLTQEGRTISVTGRWEAVGNGRVRLTAENEDEAETFTYEVEGTTLRLITEEEYDCVGECLRDVEGRYLLDPGSVHATRNETLVVLQSSTAAAPAPAEARLPSPPRHRLPLPGFR